MKLAFALFTALSSVPALAHAQGLVDLVGGGNSSPSKQSVNSGLRGSANAGRLDLEVSPNVQPLLGDPAKRTIDLGASLRWNPVCGKFDIKADFKALLGREAREEYLQGFITAGISELVGSGMELFCQSMPTSCSILQNNNIAANLKLLYSNDLCNSIENAVMTGARQGRAEALQQCLQEKQAQGKTKDEAEKACLGERPPITGFDGRVVGELDLNSEIRRYVEFSKGGSDLLNNLTQNRRMTPDAISESVQPNATATRYETLRSDFADRWSKALAGAKAGPGSALTDDALSQLVPVGAPPVSSLELELLARRSQIEIQTLIASVSAAAALLSLTREMNEVERKVEGIRASPAVEANSEQFRYLDSLLGRLKSERERLLRLYSDQERLSGVLAAGHSVGQAEISRTRMDTMKRAALGEAATQIKLGTRPFGTPDATPGASSSSRSRASAGSSSASQDCGTCGLEYSIGGGP
jgi:hypothetical protein